MDGVGGKRVRRVVKVNIVMGNPVQGMEFKTMGEFVGELSGDIRGDIRVKDTAIVKEGVLEMKKRRVGDGGRGRGKGRGGGEERMKGKTIGDGVWPSISMAEGKGGMRSEI